MGCQPGRVEPNLERRLHHPRAVSGQDQTGLSAKGRSAEPVARSGFQGVGAGSPTSMAASSHYRAIAWHTGGRNVGEPGVLRYVPSGQLTAEPDASTAGLFRLAHVSTG